MNRIIETVIYHHFTTHEYRPIRKTSPYFSGTEKKIVEVTEQSEEL